MELCNGHTIHVVGVVMSAGLYTPAVLIGFVLYISADSTFFVLCKMCLTLSCRSDMKLSDAMLT